MGATQVWEDGEEGWDLGKAAGVMIGFRVAVTWVADLADESKRNIPHRHRHTDTQTHRHTDTQTQAQTSKGMHPPTCLHTARTLIGGRHCIRRRHVGTGASRASSSTRAQTFEQVCVCV